MPTQSYPTRQPRPIEHHIYVIRGQRVMLDADLAALYGVETRRLNEAVKRNLERFPETFMFRLTDREAAAMRSQFATSPKRRIKYQPLAFTEHGVVMLSALAGLDWVKVTVEHGGVIRAWWEPRPVAEKRIRDLMAHTFPSTFGRKKG